MTITSDDRVYLEIANERCRQEELRAKGKLLYTCTTEGITDGECLAVLAEEFGEVAREVVEETIAFHKMRLTGDGTWNQQITARRKDIRKELIQVAAVCAAWVERLDSQK